MMTDRRPTPDEAARALHQVDRSGEQAIGSVSDALWVRVAFGLLLVAYLASHDFLGSDARSWVSIGFALLMVTYAVLLRTRRGASALGRPARVDRRAIAPNYALLVLLGIVVLALAAGFAGARSSVHVPYWHTGLGVALAALLVFFGPAMERALLSLGKRTRHDADGIAHGRR